MTKLYVAGKRIAFIFAGAMLLALVPAEKGAFVAGLIVGLSVGAVGTLFLLSEGARKEEKAGKCPTCGK
jgi:hypothetical protein